MKISLVSIVLLIAGWLGVLSTCLLGMTLLSVFLGEGKTFPYGFASGFGYLIALTLYLAFKQAGGTGEASKTKFIGGGRQNLSKMTAFIAMPLLWFVLIGMGTFPLLLDGRLSFDEAILYVVNHATLSGFFFPTLPGIAVHWMSMMSVLGALLTLVFCGVWMILDLPIFVKDKSQTISKSLQQGQRGEGIVGVFFALLWRFSWRFSIVIATIFLLFNALSYASWERLLPATVALVTTTGGSLLGGLKASGFSAFGLEVVMMFVMLMMASNGFFYTTLYGLRGARRRFFKRDHLFLLVLLLFFVGLSVMVSMIDGSFQKEHWSFSLHRIVLLLLSLFSTTSLEGQTTFLPIILLTITMIGGSLFAMTGGCGVERLWILCRATWENVKRLRYAGHYDLSSNQEQDNNVIFFAFMTFVAYGLFFFIGLILLSLIYPEIEEIPLLVGALLSNNGGLVERSTTLVIASSSWSLLASGIMLVGRWGALLCLFLLFRMMTFRKG